MTVICIVLLQYIGGYQPCTGDALAMIMLVVPSTSHSTLSFVFGRLIATLISSAANPWMKCEFCVDGSV